MEARLNAPRVEAVVAMTPGLARGIHAVQQAGYAQEALLLGAIDFPPLRRTAADIAASAERFWVVREDATVVGCASVEDDDEQAGVLRLASLVVHPAAQRRGIGTGLLGAVLGQVPAGVALAVHTGERNAPALALYARHGFVVQRRWTADPEQVALVRLLRR